MSKNRSKVEERLVAEESTRDSMREEHLALVEKERAYHKCVKDYETECGKNEALLARLAQVTQ